MTGNRKIVELLNHFGHSVRYHIAEEFETDLATIISDKGDITPDSIPRMDGLSTALAWDNYDELTETLSCKGTVHDTVGICYQNVHNQPVNVGDFKVDASGHKLVEHGTPPTLPTYSVRGPEDNANEPQLPHASERQKKKRKLVPQERTIEPFKESHP